MYRNGLIVSILGLTLLACSPPTEIVLASTTLGAGATVLAETHPLAPGGDCPGGGVELDIGYDDGSGSGSAGDGVLQPGEITQSRIICQSGSAGALTHLSSVAPGCLCEFGGTAVQTGLDDGLAGGIAGDGVLQPGEVREQITQCERSEPLAAPTGLDSLPPNTTCRPPDGPAQSAGVLTQLAFPDLQFTSPVALKQRPGLPLRYFVVEQTGLIKTFQAGDAAAAVALDLTRVVHAGYEPGLLQLEFHRRRAEAYVVYNHTTSTPGLRSIWTLSRFQLAAGSDYKLDPASEEVLLSIPKKHEEHNGGGAQFGPDGMLYVAVGDDDDVPSLNAQNPFVLLGKFLRIDVDSRPPPGRAYAIPAGNPFDGTNGAPEVWALGFRNPWRWSFDEQTGDLWAGDVGGATYEEIDLVKKGRNYGWGLREGNHCVSGDVTTDVGCDMNGFEPPVAEYAHSDGCSVTGGLVYRGSAIPALTGRFLYADFCQGRVWGINVENPRAGPRFLVSTLSGSTPFYSVSSFAMDAQGQVFVLSLGGWGTPGRIYKLVATPAVTPAAMLSQTGCVDAVNPQQPAAGAFPYTVNAALYTDASICKERYLYLPSGGKIFVGGDGKLAVPPGAVLMKHFRDGQKIIETRLMMRHQDGEWTGWSYRWNDAQSDATLINDAEQRQLANGATWIYPDRGDCLHCHTRPVLRAIGLEVAQLNRVSYFAQSGRWANQLSTLAALGVLQNGLPAHPAVLPALAPIADTTKSLSARARSYLHGNCSYCHQPGGGGYGNADYRATTPLSMTGACDATPIVSNFGLPAARLIAPGAPERSVVIRRMMVNDAHRMNPYRTSSDAAGVTLMQNWMGSLTSCSSQ